MSRGYRLKSKLKCHHLQPENDVPVPPFSLNRGCGGGRSSSPAPPPPPPLRSDITVLAGLPPVTTRSTIMLSLSKDLFRGGATRWHSKSGTSSRARSIRETVSGHIQYRILRAFFDNEFSIFFLFFNKKINLYYAPEETEN